MPALPNPRWERFAQELANGQPATRAYVLAGYRSNSGNAATLKAQQSVSKRVKELLAHREEIEAKGIARAIEQRGITRGDVLAMLIEDRRLAREQGQIGAAVRAAELLGKELGMFIDRKHLDVSVEQRIAAMTDEQRLEEAGKLVDRIRARLDRDRHLIDVTPEVEE
jgi:phage terminase small subunit